MRFKLIILALFFVLMGGYIYAQDCSQVDCPGRCGRFTDNNGDGFCDYGHLSKPVQGEDTVQKNIVPAKKESEPATEKKEEQSYLLQDTDVNVLQDSVSIVSEEEPASPASSKKYHFITIFLTTLGFYIVSVVLVKTNLISKPVHRKIWNVLLCITFLVSGILGLLLAVFIDYQYYPSVYMLLVRLHVQFGIVMAIISLFHLFWHIPYYKSLFIKKKESVA